MLIPTSSDTKGLPAHHGAGAPIMVATAHRHDAKTQQNKNAKDKADA